MAHDIDESIATYLAGPITPPTPAPMVPQPSQRGFAAGQTLVAHFRGQHHTCEVVERDGRSIYLLPSGDTYTSPSGAGRAITGTATNGYRFWSLRNDCNSTG